MSLAYRPADSEPLFIVCNSVQTYATPYHYRATSKRYSWRNVAGSKPFSWGSYTLTRPSGECRANLDLSPNKTTFQSALSNVCTILKIEAWLFDAVWWEVAQWHGIWISNLLCRGVLLLFGLKSPHFCPNEFISGLKTCLVTLS